MDLRKDRASAEITRLSGELALIFTVGTDQLYSCPALVSLLLRDKFQGWRTSPAWLESPQSMRVTWTGSPAIQYAVEERCCLKGNLWSCSKEEEAKCWAGKGRSGSLACDANPGSSAHLDAPWGDYSCGCPAYVALRRGFSRLIAKWPLGVTLIYTFLFSVKQE